MCEVRCIVAFRLEVMKVMVACTAIQAERDQTVCGPGQIITTVVLHRQPNVHNEEEHLCEGMAAQQQRVGSSKQAQTQCLPGLGVLCSQCRGGGVGVVQLQKKEER